jgi:tRNA threonylcarbamoyladenosine biosynthesis protein TsaE
MKNFYGTKKSFGTRKVAESLAKELASSTLKNRACVLALEGDLGGGKTTFLQGFAKALGIRDKILSPTFVIMKKFKIPARKKLFFKNFYHFDCYRTQNEKDILALGFLEIISDPSNIVAVEWSEKIKKILPSSAIKIKFGFINEEERKIEILK